MWLMKNSPSLFTDLYELAMAQVYFKKKMHETAYFEVSVRRLPENWGFFVMAGLDEIESYLDEFRFTDEDISYLRSTKLFSDDFLRYLTGHKPDVKVRALPEGSVFFANEPVLEVAGPLICAQLLESYILNILGFSIIQATLAARVAIAANGIAVVDFGLRRCQGPVASMRSARAAQMAGFPATSNVFAAKKLDFNCTGTMAHSFVEVHDTEEESFRNFAQMYGENAILLVDTYDSIEGIKKAAALAKELHEQEGIRIRGIRIDSGDLAELGNFAREHFRKNDVPFLKIFVSGDLDEYGIYDLIRAGAQIDGFGIGTRFAVSREAPAIEIIYKIVQYGDKGLFKTSPDKQSRPGRKSIVRIRDKYYQKDVVSTFKISPDDLLKPFESAERMPAIQKRLAAELSCLSDSVKAIRNPQVYPVEFA
ncbi:MAG: nicotinate phosphoribosyltransferase [Sedimentisphaerales bacterium]|nr:nicotinate phosphoribosyltransferase [Sedimentisphaerales bacterium]